MRNQEMSLIDIHNHLLYGMDDGAKDIAEMRAILDTAADQHIGSIFATPHVQPGVVPFDWMGFVERIGQANDYCAAMGYKLRVFSGCEILYTEATVRLLQARALPTLGGSSWVLVEWSENEKESAIRNAVRDLANAGFRSIIAHAERVKAVRRNPEFLRDIKSAFGARIQVNASSILDGRQRGLVDRLFGMNLADYVASDAHGTVQRSLNLMRAFARISEWYGAETARAVMMENPGMEVLSCCSEVE